MKCVTANGDLKLIRNSIACIKGETQATICLTMKVTYNTLREEHLDNNKLT